jgi:succinate-semialdehyde dehydrogenase/glutarate-semialdehyde dehydrogenase
LQKKTAASAIVLAVSKLEAAATRARLDGYSCNKNIHPKIPRETMERELLAFFNPATSTQFGSVNMNTPGEVQQAVRDMRKAFPEWSRKSVRERSDILHKLQHVLIERRDEISQVLNQDCGKSRQDGLLELFVAVDMLSQYRGHAQAWLKRQRVSSGLYLFKRCYIEHRPHGVTAIISPWNYPFTLSMPP